MSLQELPSITGHVHSHDLLEPAPKKPCREATKSPFSDISEATSVSDSCVPYSSQSPKELQQTFDMSAQVWQAAFIAVAKGRVPSHESMGSPVSLVGLVVSRLGAVHLPEIKRPDLLDLGTHAHMCACRFWTTDSHTWEWRVTRLLGRPERKCSCCLLPQRMVSLFHICLADTELLFSLSCGCRCPFRRR